ncbi:MULTISPECIES: ATP-binding protein [unclassified Limnobacter]|uniref:hybrid sensor histidine kinase/response regulator n=1 Tax=unclassified Limnobacter TaxID=2630203 RepID=UPI000C4AA549|nr:MULTISPECIES: ATP-binding protein [unclassified Limnobacter]MAZ10144.1 hybrid sensor histidine kinase/response regulator [Sutterellaceae bacterium]|tara:strand:- start:24785 stop:28222 length:3438 start_codon:yes stop_codon:yes gene_type:complete
MTASQRVFKVRRHYNKWVADQTLEDYALRFTARKGRHMSIRTVGHTALGATAFLALEGIAASITLNYGFVNAVAAMLVVCLLFFITGFPITYYSAKHGLDIDLLTRGAGFGYMGSTITSLIYASFTFIFFAIEAAILASALQALFGIPLPLGYFLAAVAVLPIVTHGITAISKFQVGTQPVWLVLQLAALLVVVIAEFRQLPDWASYTPVDLPEAGSFNVLLFGAAASVLFALVAQIGEQVDYLRFMPEKTKNNARQWWFWLIVSGPGWVFMGLLKMLLGSFLAYLAIQAGGSFAQASDPTYMYQRVFTYLTQSPSVALVLAGLMVVVCQMKINLTNAYAGSIAWSNFFSRVTHSHPGRVVWLVFNVAIALILMELGIYQALEAILGIFAIVAVSWLGSLAADLLINKPLGLSPSYVEFKRAHLYDVNPVGVGSMVLASVLGLLCYLGVFGPVLATLSHFVALGVCFVAVPVLALLTGSKYYLARQSHQLIPIIEEKINLHLESKGNYRRLTLKCVICENEFEREDMAFCTAYENPICSLCCSLDSRCLDSCKPKARLSDQVIEFLSMFLSPRWVRKINSRLGRFTGLWGLLALVNAAVLSLVFQQLKPENASESALLSQAILMMYFILLIVSGVVSWLFILAHESRLVAQTESNRQTRKLVKEIEAHKETDRALQAAKELAERSNDAKSRYLSGISHELRTPLQSIMGYAQLLANKADTPPRHQEGLAIIERSGQYLTDLIEGLLDISKIEAGRLMLNKNQVRIRELIAQLATMFELQALQKGVMFECRVVDTLPECVSTDEKRLRQILINLLSNAVKYTEHGKVQFEVRYRNQVAEFSITDTGVGIAPEHMDRIFQPFERVRTTHTANMPGTGLGLTIVRLLTDIMGGDLKVDSTEGLGSRFAVSLMLPWVQRSELAADLPRRILGYAGPRRTIVLVDDDAILRGFLSDLLIPLGFVVLEAPNGQFCLDLLDQEIELRTVDLFLLDVNMPVMDGLELAAELKRRKLNAPVLMLSADAREHHRAPEEKSLYDDYLVKPVDNQKLLDKLAHHLKLEWINEQHNQQIPLLANQQSISGSSPDFVFPAHPLLIELKVCAEMGYRKGVQEVLDKIELAQVLPAPALSKLKEQARTFQFQKLAEQLDAS